jgi:hypothetical protein
MSKENDEEVKTKTLEITMDKLKHGNAKPKKKKSSKKKKVHFKKKSTPKKKAPKAKKLPKPKKAKQPKMPKMPKIDLPKLVPIKPSKPGVKVPTKKSEAMLVNAAPMKTAMTDYANLGPYVMTHVREPAMSVNHMKALPLYNTINEAAQEIKEMYVNVEKIKKTATTEHEERVLNEVMKEINKKIIEYNTAMYRGETEKAGRILTSIAKLNEVVKQLLFERDIDPIPPRKHPLGKWAHFLPPGVEEDPPGASTFSSKTLVLEPDPEPKPKAKTKEKGKSPLIEVVGEEEEEEEEVKDEPKIQSIESLNTEISTVEKRLSDLPILIKLKQTAKSKAKKEGKTQKVADAELRIKTLKDEKIFLANQLPKLKRDLEDLQVALEQGEEGAGMLGGMSQAIEEYIQTPEIDHAIGLVANEMGQKAMPNPLMMGSGPKRPRSRLDKSLNKEPWSEGRLTYEQERDFREAYIRGLTQKQLAPEQHRERLEMAKHDPHEMGQFDPNPLMMGSGIDMAGSGIFDWLIEKIGDFASTKMREISRGQPRWEAEMKKRRGKGGTKIWGNYCGPMWTSGKVMAAQDAKDEDWSVPPTDGLDFGCKEHDFECAQAGELGCPKSADQKLVSTALKEMRKGPLKKRAVSGAVAAAIKAASLTRGHGKTKLGGVEPWVTRIRENIINEIGQPAGPYWLNSLDDALSGQTDPVQALFSIENKLEELNQMLIHPGMQPMGLWVKRSLEIAIETLRNPLPREKSPIETKGRGKKGGKKGGVLTDDEVMNMANIPLLRLYQELDWYQNNIPTQQHMADYNWHIMVIDRIEDMIRQKESPGPTPRGDGKKGGGPKKSWIQQQRDNPTQAMENKLAQLQASNEIIIQAMKQRRQERRDAVARGDDDEKKRLDKILEKLAQRHRDNFDYIDRLWNTLNPRDDDDAPPPVRRQLAFKGSSRKKCSKHGGIQSVAPVIAQLQAELTQLYANKEQAKQYMDQLTATVFANPQERDQAVNLINQMLAYTRQVNTRINDIHRILQGLVFPN